jgi:diguanylate cyclase (GGDEF)-like protein
MVAAAQLARTGVATAGATFIRRSPLVEGYGRMSFRSRLRLFFALIVIVPMLALGIVLFALTAQTETGKADAGIAAGARAAVGVYREEADRARPALRRMVRDPELRRAVAAGRRHVAERRLRELVIGVVVQAELWSPSGVLLARAGSSRGVAFADGAIGARGPRRAVLSVSVTGAGDFADRVKALTSLDALLLRGPDRLASTLAGHTFPTLLPPAGGITDVDVAGEQYRGKFVPIEAAAGPPVRLATITPRASFAQRIASNRVVIVLVTSMFVLLALISGAVVSRALTGQVTTFLEAARRLSRGDFRKLVPLQGNDEFAELGREFNDMSVQLEGKMEEVERKRQELAETIRRVGDALATGLDRDGVVALAVRQAVDACEAEVGRALPLAHGAFSGCAVGEIAGDLKKAIEAAERDVFVVRPDVGSELLGALEGDDRAERTRRAVSAHGPGVHALSIGLRSLVDGPEYLGAISIARHGRTFTREEEDLLEYLAGQAVVSIENASLHEAIEQQAVTDELTGLANVRAFTSVMDTEIERGRRFEHPLGLVMVDLDNFKGVNDTYGHQQGDEVLAHVAWVLRDVSRDLDTVVRYGGEELAVVLPQTDAAGASRLAERMRVAVESLHVPRVDGRGTIEVTASFGVASVPENAVDRNELIAAADAALYAAKAAGKNRVERAGMTLAEPSSRPR